jgi:hypothetical protein
LTALLLAVVAQAGELPRGGFLGLQVGAVPAEEGRALGIASGVKVLKLVDGGSGKAAGIQPGDVITQIDSSNVAGADAFVDFARHLHAGDVVTISLLRGGKPKDVRMEVRPRPFETSPDAGVWYTSISIADGSRRRVIVTKPKQPGRHPAILYMTGIGCFSQESLDRSSPDAKLLYGLTAAGFVTMRVEKSGMGDSEGPPCASPDADLDSEVRGYIAGLRALKQYDFVDSRNIFLLGLSIGGVEAALVARRELVRGVVVVNTVAKPFLEYLLETRRRQLQLRHVPYDEIDRRLRENELCNHRLLIEKEPAEELVKRLPSCREHVDYPAPVTFMRQWAAIDPAAEWKEVSAPVLIVYGLSDFVATTGDHPYLDAVLNSFHPGQATLKPIAGMDHYLTRAASMEESITRPAGTPGEFDSDVVDAIASWLRTQRISA